ncbi:MAG: hypothetical protein ACK56F_24350, partial [bacterium]
PMMARRCAWALVSRASVTTAPIVVAGSAAWPLIRRPRASSGKRAGQPRPPNSRSCSSGPAQKWPVSPIVATPIALTAMKACTARPRRVSRSATRVGPTSSRACRARSRWPTPRAGGAAAPSRRRGSRDPLVGVPGRRRRRAAGCGAARRSPRRGRCH